MESEIRNPKSEITDSAFEDLPWLGCDVIVVETEEWRRDPIGALLRESARLGAASPRMVVWGQQTHGDGVAVVDETHPLLTASPSPDRAVGARLPQTDAIILLSPGILAAVRTADCVPMIVADAARRRAAVIHAGWRGTWHQIARKAIRRMLSLGSRARDLRLWIGPCVRQASYEVSADLARQFAGAFPEAARAGAVAGRYLDLAAINRWQARAMGVPAEAIADCGVCAFADRRFPSYRRDGDKAGRILTRVIIHS